MTDEVPWHTTLIAAIVDPRHRRVLIFDGPNGPTLPQLDFEEDMWFADGAADLQAMFLQDYGFDTVVLWLAQEQSDGNAHINRSILAVELLEQRSDLPSGSFWVERAGLANLSFAQPDYQPVLDQILHELAPGAQPAERPDWSQPGWYPQALRWIETRLNEGGHQLSAPITQLKAWCLSVVLRAPTSSGSFYFKQATPLPLFANEPRLIQDLSQHYPDIFPTPFAVDPEREWMLLADLGTVVREDTQERHNTELREKVMRAWSTFQRTAAHDPQRLLDAGCVDRRLPILRAAITPLIADPNVYPDLTSDEVKTIRALEPRLLELCDELESFGIPASLVHGDLHWGNIAHRGDNIAIFDWTDSNLSHPFFDLATLLGIDRAYPDRDATIDRLRTAYLAAFEDIAPLPRLLEATKIAEVLGALHQVVSYESIVKSVEPVARRDLGTGLTHFWREVLRTVQSLDQA